MAFLKQKEKEKEESKSKEAIRQDRNTKQNEVLNHMVLKGKWMVNQTDNWKTMCNN